MSTPDLAVIGGSGFYTFLDDPETVEVETPYGAPSAPIAVGTVGDRSVAFLPRHGADHQFPAHQVPYRANLWALRSLGVRQILAPCAVGGLQADYGPGTYVVPDQLVDRTTARIQTYYDEGANHISFADPYCSTPAPTSRGRPGRTRSRGRRRDGHHRGPRFSTRAESQWYAGQGWAVIGMTGHPEAVLARELALCYATVALVTDHDAGVDEAEAVTVDEVFKVFAEHTDTLKSVLAGVIGTVGTDRDCACSHAVDGMDLPFELP